MNKKQLLVLISAALLLSPLAQARDDMMKFPIAGALESAEAKDKLSGEVKFYFGNQKHAAPKQKMGSATSNKKTNFFHKEPNEACDRAFVSALISFQGSALRDGGNAVINLKSVTKNRDFVSETEYQCNVGNITGGVALRGDIVKLR
jgi:hypothetical protein